MNRGDLVGVNVTVGGLANRGIANPGRLIDCLFQRPMYATIRPQLWGRSGAPRLGGQ